MKKDLFSKSIVLAGLIIPALGSSAWSAASFQTQSIAAQLEADARALSNEAERSVAYGGQREQDALANLSQLAADSQTLREATLSQNDYQLQDLIQSISQDYDAAQQTIGNLTQSYSVQALFTRVTQDVSQLRGAANDSGGISLGGDLQALAQQLDAQAQNTLARAEQEAGINGGIIVVDPGHIPGRPNPPARRIPGLDAGTSQALMDLRQLAAQASRVDADLSSGYADAAAARQDLQIMQSQQFRAVNSVSRSRLSASVRQSLSEVGRESAQLSAAVAQEGEVLDAPPSGFEIGIGLIR